MLRLPRVSTLNPGKALGLALRSVVLGADEAGLVVRAQVSCADVQRQAVFVNVTDIPAIQIELINASEPATVVAAGE